MLGSSQLRLELFQLQPLLILLLGQLGIRILEMV